MRWSNFSSTVEVTLACPHNINKSMVPPKRITRTYQEPIGLRLQLLGGGRELGTRTQQALALTHDAARVPSESARRDAQFCTEQVASSNKSVHAASHNRRHGKYVPTTRCACAATALRTARSRLMASPLSCFFFSKNRSWDASASRQHTSTRCTTRFLRSRTRSAHDFWNAGDTPGSIPYRLAMVLDFPRALRAPVPSCDGLAAATDDASLLRRYVSLAFMAGGAVDRMGDGRQRLALLETSGRQSRALSGRGRSETAYPARRAFRLFLAPTAHKVRRWVGSMLSPKLKWAVTLH
jgi:hypothetical protein